MRREMPGATQVDEKGHEGNTAVVIAYIPGMLKETWDIVTAASRIYAFVFPLSSVAA